MHLKEYDNNAKVEIYSGLSESEQFLFKIYVNNVCKEIFTE